MRVARPQKVTRTAFRWMRHFKDAAMPTVLEMLVAEHWGERKAAVGLLRQWGKLTEAHRKRALADPHIAVRHAAVGQRWYPPGYSGGQCPDGTDRDLQA